MSWIMRWRSGLVVAIGASCPERGGCDHHILSDGRFHRSDLPAAPKEQVRSITLHLVGVCVNRIGMCLVYHTLMDTQTILAAGKTLEVARRTRVTMVNRARRADE